MFRERTFGANDCRQSSYGAVSGGNAPLSGVSKNTMPFEIKSIDQQTFDAVYTPQLTNQLNGFIHPTRDWFDLSRRRWMVEQARGIYFLEASLADRTDWAFSYVLIQNGEFALVRTEDHFHYAFVKISAGFLLRLDEVKGLVAEALRVGGVHLDGCYDLPSDFGMNLPNINAVLRTQFITGKTRKA
jgi:hypothetical protein